METTPETNVIEFPSKTTPITDFAYQSLNELDDEVNHFFPKKDGAEFEMYMNLVGALTFRLLCNGFCKHELRDFMLREIDDAQDCKDEIDEAESYNQMEMEEEEF